MSNLPFPAAASSIYSHPIGILLVPIVSRIFKIVMYFFNVYFLGKLKEWSLVLYGTSIQPYSPRNDFPKAERVRSSPIEDPTEDYGDDYAGNIKQHAFLQM